MPPAPSGTFWKHWYSHDVLPLAALMAVALGGASYFGFRAAHAPDVVWDRKRNPAPYADIRQDEGVKLLQYNVRYVYLTS